MADHDISKAILIKLSSGGDGESIITLAPKTSDGLATFKGRRIDVILTIAGETVGKIPLTLGDPQIAGPKGEPPPSKSSR